MSNSDCIPNGELAQFLLGKLAGARFEQVVEHVDLCPSCQETVQSLSSQSDTFADGWRGEMAEDSCEREPEYRRAAEQLVAAAPPAERETEPPVGQLGPYRLLERLGAGGMGTVYKAVHGKLKRTVALKILPTSRWTNAAAIRRFEREMQAIGQLDHPHIVRASDAGEDHGMHYLVMEYVDGLDLSRVVSRLGRLPVAEACEVARQAALALECAHENRLVHRDIKPSNLMLTRDGRIKLLDLGLALLGDEHAVDRNELTTVGQLMGTLDYMSPEQGMDSHEVDIRADIYSLGATLYKLLVGHAPFAAPQYNTLLKKVSALANKPSPSVGLERDDLPPALIAVIDRMLAKQPSERFDSPRAAAEALAPFAARADLAGLARRALRAKEADEALAAHPLVPPVVKPKAQPARGRSRKAPLVIALLLGLLLLAAAVVIRIQTDRGDLIVRAEAADARVVIKRADGRPVQELQLEQGDNRIRVRSGQYQIELLGQSDQLELTRNSLTVKRGEQVVVSIQRRERAEAMGSGAMPGMGGIGGMSGMMPGGMSGGPGMYPGRGQSPGRAMEDEADAMQGIEPTPGIGGYDEDHMMDMGMTDEEMRSMDMMGGARGYLGGMGGMMGDQPPGRRSQPTYDGQVYDVWLGKLANERKPELLTEAVRAFAVLGDDDPELAARSAAAILGLMQRYGSRVIDSSPRGVLIEKSREVLLGMPAEIVVDALKTELVEGNTRSRSFVNFMVGPAYGTLSGMSYGIEGTEFLTAVNRSADELTRLLVAMPEDEAASVRADALGYVIARSRRVGKDLEDIEGLLPRLRAGLESVDYDMLYTASQALVDLEPNHEQLLPALIRLLSAPHDYHRTGAVISLGKLGPRAAPAVESLIEILKPLVSGYAGGDPFGGGYGDYSGGFFGGTQNVHREAIVALGKIGPSARAALPLLRKILTTGNHVGEINEAIAQIERVDGGGAGENDGAAP